MSPDLRAITPTATPWGARLQFLFDDGTLEEMDISFSDLVLTALSLLEATRTKTPRPPAGLPNNELWSLMFAWKVRAWSQKRAITLAIDLLVIHQEVLTLHKQEGGS